MPTVTAKLDAILNEQTDIGGHISVQLCGYGSQVPRVNGVAMLSQVEALNFSPNPSGIITITLFGNDEISPAGTYYTFTFMNDNGDVVQVNAYRFLSSTPTYDLTLIDPYDPNQPPPPLPPLITNLLLVVPWSATPEFPGDVYTSYRIMLDGDITSSTAPGTVSGNLYTYIIVQDGVGNRQFAWPANCHGASPINPTPNSVTVQTFVMSVSDLRAIGPGMWMF